MMIDPLIQYSLLGTFSLMFALSAMEKFSDRAGFLHQVANYRLLPAPLVPVTANAVIVLEVVAATLLITEGYWYGAAIGTSLLVTYGLAMLFNLLRGRTHIDCGCLGSRGEGISYYHVLRNLLMTLMLSLCLMPATAREINGLDYFVIIAALVAAMLTFATANLLLASHLDQRNWWQS